MPKFDDPGLRRGRLSAGPSSPSIQHSTLIAVVEQPLELAGRGTVPGIERESAKKMLHRWCDEVAAAGHAIARICVAYEADAYGCIMVRSPGGSTEYRVLRRLRRAIDSQGSIQGRV